MSSETHWYEAHSELLRFAIILRDAGAFDGEDPIDRVLYYFEKPWKWSGEHDRWIALGRPIGLSDMSALQEAS